MKVIGLCGGSGSGKGIACMAFSEFGIHSLDTDALYHGLISSKSKCTSDLEAEFGNKILNSDGSVNRKTLSDIVFENPDKLKRLNEISHFHILNGCRDWLSNERENGSSFAIIDAPLLFESNFDSECDIIISVTADRELRISRIMARDGIDRRKAEKRIDLQKSDEFLRDRSDFVIENNGSYDELREKIKEITEKISTWG